MSISPKIIVVARQAGSANAFAPLVKALQYSEYQVVVLGLSHAIIAWEQNSIPCISVSSFAEALPFLESHSDASFLLSGTSEFADDDALFWDWAKKCNIPCLAWIDTWGGYRKRFTPDSGSAFSLIPEYIGVIDDCAETGLREDGCLSKNIVQVGHPGLDQLHYLVAPPVESRVEYAPLDSFFVLFVSEWLSKYPDIVEEYGFSEKIVIPELISKLSSIAGVVETKIHLGLKLHPRENREDMEAFLSKPSLPLNITVSIVEGDRLLLPRVADVVCGMTSMLLVESALMGTPVLSFQPSRKRKNDITDNREGIRVLTSSVQLEKALHDIFLKHNGWRPRPPLSFPSSLQQFTQFIDEHSRT